MIGRKISTVVAVALATAPAMAQAQTFDWNVKAHRLMLAGALNNWADFCSGVFHFDRVPKKPNEALEPKINSHLLLSSTPMMEVERWGGCRGLPLPPLRGLLCLEADADRRRLVEC